MCRFKAIVVIYSITFMVTYDTTDLHATLFSYTEECPVDCFAVSSEFFDEKSAKVQLKVTTESSKPVRRIDADIAFSVVMDLQQRR
eukprot:757291-Hanusia_phi.AAC.5